ncbi:MAG: TM1802 family CRISPR-associated protein [Saprospiraceae bacterium]|nr:TM1802 family CRISPR-associated protein [Saprospiraceae bacterium]
MIQTLYTIGKVLSQNEEYKKYFEPWEDPFREGKIIVAEFKNSEYQKGSLSIGEDKKENNLKKYLYRQFNRGANIVPAFNVSKTKNKHSGKKTFDKFVKCLQNYHSTHFKFEVKLKGNKLQSSIIEKYQYLKTDLESFEFDSKDNYLFTIKIDGKWLGEVDYFLEFFKQNYLRSYFTKNYEGEIVSKNPSYTCSITNDKTEVYGFVDTLGFTVDSPSFIRGGFNQSEAYKMFPASKEAVKLLDGSFNLVLDKLSRTFFTYQNGKFVNTGLQYLIVPHFIRRDNQEMLEEGIEAFLENSKGNSFRTTGNSIISNETILKAITEERKLQGAVYYDILFYQQNKAQFLIKLHLADVIPSRISKVFRLKQSIEKRYGNITKIEFEDKKTKKKAVINFYINFSVIKDYFCKEKKDGNRKKYIFQPYFFKILESVFYGTPLNEQQILKAFLKQIQTDFKQQNEDGKSTLYIRRTKTSFALYQYFLKLGLFKNRTPMEENQEQTVHLTAEEFINQHLEFFDSQYKIGVFLLGYLSAYLMGKQYKKLKSNPFMKQLTA